MVYTAGREGFEMLKWVVWVGCAREREKRKLTLNIVSRKYLGHRGAEKK